MTTAAGPTRRGDLRQLEPITPGRPPNTQHRHSHPRSTLAWFHPPPPPAGSSAHAAAQNHRPAPDRDGETHPHPTSRASDRAGDTSRRRGRGGGRAAGGAGAPHQLARRRRARGVQGWTRTGARHPARSVAPGVVLAFPALRRPRIRGRSPCPAASSAPAKRMRIPVARSRRQGRPVTAILDGQDVPSPSTDRPIHRSLQPPGVCFKQKDGADRRDPPVCPSVACACL